MFNRGDYFSTRGRRGNDSGHDGYDSLRGRYNSGRGGYNRGSYDSGCGERGSERGGYNSIRGRIDSDRGGYDSGRGSYNSGRGGYDYGRGGSERGGYVSTRGSRGIDSDRGAYNFGRGGYDSGRGGYDSIRGERGSERGGYGGGYGSTRGCRGIDSDRGSYNSGRGGYDSGRGGYDYGRGGNERGGYVSTRGIRENESDRGTYDSGRGGYDYGRGGIERGGYGSTRGSRGNDSSRGGYGSTRGIRGNDSGRGGYNSGRGSFESGRGRDGSINSEYKCLASQFKISIGQKSYAFNYEVDIIHELDSGGRSLSKKCDRELCRHLVTQLCEFNGIDYVYDGQSLLWSNQLLEDPFEFACAAADFDDYMKSKLRQEGGLVLKIKLVGQLNLADFNNYLNGGDDSNGERRTQRNVCELILSSSAINRGEYTFGGIGSLFQTREAPFHGLVTREGNSKGVHVIEWNNKPQLIMSLEYSNKLFYPSGQSFLMLVDNLVSDGWKMEDLVKLFCGLKLSLTYNPSRIITFDEFTAESVSQLQINDISMKEFFEQRWNIQLRRLDKKAVIAKSYENNIYGNVEKFPIEILIIVPNQSVPADRLPRWLHDKSLEINRLKTADRYERIMMQHQQMGFNTNDSICNAFGLSVENHMISGPFSRLPISIVIVKNNQHLTVKDDGSFSFERNQYLVPAHIRRLIVLTSKSSQQKSMECIGFIQQEANKKGIRIDEILYQQFNTNSTNANEWIAALRDHSNAFVIAVDDNSDSHALLKLSSAVNRVPTQHVHFDTAKLVSTGGRGMTRENIVHQLNVKAGGLNHKVLFDRDIVNLNLDNENVFVLGLDVCHPTGNNFRGVTIVPSTVGVVGNYLENPNSFAGSFFYQKPRQEYVDPTFLQLTVKAMLQRNPRLEKIDTIVILRDGVSEGQYSKILDTEVAAVKKCCGEIYNHTNTRIICIIVTKNGNARHFDVTYKRPQSLPPRSVVTFGCRLNFNQFYIVPHRAFQGTAKAIMVTVIQDDVGCEAFEIQKFILALTNLHQIVCAPISLPEPVYLADALAQRGYEIFAALKQYSPNQIQRDESGSIKLHDLSYQLGLNFEKSQ